MFLFHLEGGEAEASWRCASTTTHTPLLGLPGRIRLGRVKGAFVREIRIAMEKCVSAKSLRN